MIAISICDRCGDAEKKRRKKKQKNKNKKQWAENMNTEQVKKNTCHLEGSRKSISKVHQVIRRNPREINQETNRGTIKTTDRILSGFSLISSIFALFHCVFFQFFK